MLLETDFIFSIFIKRYRLFGQISTNGNGKQLKHDRQYVHKGAKK